MDDSAPGLAQVCGRACGAVATARCRGCQAEMWPWRFAAGHHHAHRIPARDSGWRRASPRSEEHTSELQSLMRISYAVFCLKTNKHTRKTPRLQCIHKTE